MVLLPLDAQSPGESGHARAPGPDSGPQCRSLADLTEGKTAEAEGVAAGRDTGAPRCRARCLGTCSGPPAHYLRTPPTISEEPCALASDRPSLSCHSSSPQPPAISPGPALWRATPPRLPRPRW